MGAKPATKSNHTSDPGRQNLLGELDPASAYKKKKDMQNTGEVSCKKLITTFPIHEFHRSRNQIHSSGICLAIGGCSTITIKGTGLHAPSTMVLEAALGTPGIKINNRRVGITPSVSQSGHMEWCDPSLAAVVKGRKPPSPPTGFVKINCCLGITPGFTSGGDK